MIPDHKQKTWKEGKATEGEILKRVEVETSWMNVEREKCSCKHDERQQMSIKKP